MNRSSQDAPGKPSAGPSEPHPHLPVEASGPQLLAPTLVIIARVVVVLVGGAYILSKMIPVWESLGIRVRIGGREALKEGEVAFLHVDLTMVPDELMDRAHRYPLVINGSAIDMSKRRVSRHLVKRRGSWNGPVIVKTDLNYGGKSERARELGTPSGGRLKSARRRLPWTLTGDLKPAQYPVYPSKRDVPLLAWLNRRLVVEEFRPERKGEFYCLRNWIFLGDRELTVRSWGRNPVLKAVDVVDREYDIEIPEELRRLREELGFDFGKFDFVVSDGKVCLFDANRTPTVAPRRNVPKPEGDRDRLAELAEGIFTWVPRSPTRG